MATIIVADDDAPVRAIVVKVLTQEGHTVREVPNGAALLDQQRAGPADLIVTDLYMPDMDGLEAIIRLRQEWPQLRILALSGGGYRHKHDVLALARNAGAVGALAKPFRNEELVVAVTRALASA